MKIERKTCTVCKINKNLSEYYSRDAYSKKNGSYTYYQPYCKKCTGEKARNSNRNIEVKNMNSAKWRERPENREIKKLHSKKYRDSGKQREWARRNKDKLKKYMQERNQHKKHTIKKSEWINCKQYFNNSCAYCGLHEDNHFKMWKDDLKKIDLHKDHVNHEGANDLSNCVPACQSCNSSKHDFKLEVWYSENNKKINIYDEFKLHKIQKWLSEDYKRFIK